MLHLRKQYDVTLPLIFMNSFRTSADTMAALARYGDLPVEGLPLEFLQNKVPKLLAKDLLPVSWPKDPDLEWCPPGHGDLYTALRGTGLLDRLIEVGYERVFVSNSDNLGAVPDARIAGWFAGSGAPFAIEAVRRTPRTARAATSRAARTTAGWCSGRPRRRCPPTRRRWPTSSGTGSARPTTCGSTSAMKHALDVRQGVLGLPLIRNVKTVDPGDKKTPEVIQVETAMGAAIEVFEDSKLIEVGRDRFVPVKTTNDLLVLRSDVYDLGKDFVLDRWPTRCRSSTSTATSTSWSASSTSASPRARRRCARRPRSRRGRLDVRPRRAGDR